MNHHSSSYNKTQKIKKKNHQPIFCCDHMCNNHHSFTYTDEEREDDMLGLDLELVIWGYLMLEYSLSFILFLCKVTTWLESRVPDLNKLSHSVLCLTPECSWHKTQCWPSVRQLKDIKAIIIVWRVTWCILFSILEDAVVLTSRFVEYLLLLQPLLSRVYVLLNCHVDELVLGLSLHHAWPLLPHPLDGLRDVDVTV